MDLQVLLDSSLTQGENPLKQDFYNGRLEVSGIVMYLPPDRADHTADDASSRSRAPHFKAAVQKQSAAGGLQRSAQKREEY
jgi:hypothetical protein